MTRSSRARRRGSARRASNATCSSGSGARRYSPKNACAQAQALDATAYEVHEAVGQPSARDRQMRRRPKRPTVGRLRIVPESPDALIGLADGAGGQQRPVEAERDAEARDRGAAALCGAHMEYGSFLFQQGRSAARRSSPTSARRASSPTIRARSTTSAVAYMYVGDFGKSTEALSRSLAIEPRQASYSNIGTGTLLPRPVRGGWRMFRKAIELAPGGSRLWGNLADALLFDGNAGEARRPTPARWNWQRGSSPSTRTMASTRRRRRTMRPGCGAGTGPDSASRTPWHQGKRQ